MRDVVAIIRALGLSSAETVVSESTVPSLGSCVGEGVFRFGDLRVVLVKVPVKLIETDAVDKDEEWGVTLGILLG